MLTFQTIADMPLNQMSLATNNVLTAVAQGKLSGNLLLFGKNGSGKSTLARHLPIWYQHANGFSDGYLAADIDVPAGIDFDKLKNIASLASGNPTGRDWIVLDEADKSTDKTAFGKLHSMLEWNPQAKTFILTANSISVFPQGILSRCRAIEIVAPTPTEYLAHAQTVLAKRGVVKTDAYVLNVLSAAASSGADCRHYEQAIELIF